MVRKSPFTTSTAGVHRAAMVARCEVPGGAGRQHEGHNSKRFGENDRPGRRTTPEKGPRTTKDRSSIRACFEERLIIRLRLGS
jgi:hypothetical protein